jgi:hypothetical protein
MILYAFRTGSGKGTLWQLVKNHSLKGLVFQTLVWMEIQRW